MGSHSGRKNNDHEYHHTADNICFVVREIHRGEIKRCVRCVRSRDTYGGDDLASRIQLVAPVVTGIIVLGEAFVLPRTEAYQALAVRFPFDDGTSRAIWRRDFRLAAPVEIAYGMGIGVLGEGIRGVLCPG